MCGIAAIVSTKFDVFQTTIQSLEQLQNRGYDSAGIGVTQDNKFVVSKFASCSDFNAIEKLKQVNNIMSNIAIGHTRWATHGPKNDVNSHPHISSDGRVMLVHNGVIENFNVLKQDLKNNGFSFSSNTDSEVIVNLIAFHYRKNNCAHKSIDCAIKQLSGTWGLVIMFKDRNNELFCARKGSPILIGKSIDNEFVIVASEQSAFSGLTSNYMILDNDDICNIVIKNEKILIHTCEKYKFETCTQIKSSDNSLIDFKHWTEKEIHQQKDVVQQVLNFGGRVHEKLIKLGGLDENLGALHSIDHIIILGCGTSYYAGNVGIHYLKRVCSFHTVQVFDGAEFNIYDIPQSGKTGIIMISQSGETKDLHRCIDIVRLYRSNIMLIGVINEVDSLIAREVDCGCYLNIGKERGVASTKSFVAQIIVLSLISLWFEQIQKKVENHIRTRYLDDLRKLTNQLIHVIDNVAISLRKWVDAYYGVSSMFILGKGIMEPIAKEGSLKIKEISYIHAEGYSGSSLKHGPFALLHHDTPVLLLINEDEHKEKMLNVYEQVMSRGAPILVITDSEEVQKLINDAIIYPYNNNYSCILCVVILQYFAYLLSLKKNINPDFPRNLAKVVTVE